MMRPLVLGCLALLVGAAAASAADLDEGRRLYDAPPAFQDGTAPGDGPRFGADGSPPMADDDEDDDDGPAAGPQGWAGPPPPSDGACRIRRTPWGPERLCEH